jgi:hypothetical protein
VGLGDLVASGINHALTLVEALVEDQGVRRMQISHALRTVCFVLSGTHEMVASPVFNKIWFMIVGGLEYLS